MPAEIESIMYVGETPWHGSGVYVGDEDVDSKTAIINAGLDWKVNKQPVYAPIDGVNMVEIPAYKATVRQDDGKILGIVGSRYQPIQNVEAFEFMDSLVDEGLMKYHTAGSLREGKRIWLLGKIGDSEVVPKDKVDHYLLLHNSHDGRTALRVLFTAVRVVCANTIQIALQRGKHEGIYVRHTVNLQERLHQAKEILGLAKRQFNNFTQFAQAAQQVQIDHNLWNEITKQLFPDPPAPAKPGRAKKARSDLTLLFEDGIGQDIPGVSGTGWAAFNAVTEYANFHRVARGAQKQERRFESSLFGASAKLINKAQNIITEIAA
jgi:phage/plasmid-like protein (TIGR03299 family)